MRCWEFPPGPGVRHHRAFVLAAIILLLACLETAGQTGDGAQILNLNIVATDRRGQPVSDLASSEIRITDNGKPQRLLSSIALIGGYRHRRSCQPASFQIARLPRFPTLQLCFWTF
jgi:hypothetical protein